MMRTTTLSLATAAAITLGFTGCGGGESDEDLKPKIEETAKKLESDKKGYKAADYNTPSRRLAQPQTPKSGLMNKAARTQYNRYLDGKQLSPDQLESVKLAAEAALGESIGSLLYVKRATIRLSLPAISKPIEDDDDVKPSSRVASGTVWIELADGIFTLNAEQVAAVATLAASNFPYLDARNIAVLDTNGKPYQYGGSDPSISGAPDQVKRVTERDIKRKAELLLAAYEAKAEASVSVALHGGVGRVLYEESMETEQGVPTQAPKKGESPSPRGATSKERKSVTRYALVYEPVLENSLLSVTIPDHFKLSDERVRLLKDILRNGTGIPTANIVIGQLSVEKIDQGKRIDTGEDDVTENAGD